jgi:hypothetical protein
MLTMLSSNTLPVFAGDLPLATLTPTPQPTPVRCVSDCNGNNLIAIDEVVRSVAISLGQQPLSACTRADGNGNGRVTVDELVQGVLNNLHGCGIRPPSPTRTASPTTTATPANTATPTRTPTATTTRTPTTSATPSVTRTVSPTVTPNTLSVCGGVLSSTPKLCNVEVVPNPVPLFGSFRVRYCISDIEGDLRQACTAIRTSPEEPLPVCELVTVIGGTINGCFNSNQQLSTLPAGNYGLIVSFDDRAGNRSNIVETGFRISAQ